MRDENNLLYPRYHSHCRQIRPLRQSASTVHRSVSANCCPFIRRAFRPLLLPPDDMRFRAGCSRASDTETPVLPRTIRQLSVTRRESVFLPVNAFLCMKLVRIVSDAVLRCQQKPASVVSKASLFSARQSPHPMRRRRRPFRLRNPAARRPLPHDCCRRRPLRPLSP